MISLVKVFLYNFYRYLKLNKARIYEHYRAEFSRHVVRILQDNKAEFITGLSSPQHLLHVLFLNIRLEGAHETCLCIDFS